MTEQFPPLRPREHLLPTLFDRLRDDAPARKTELSDNYTVSANRLREIVQRDLMLLLNTTNLEDEIDVGKYPQVASSVVNYGVPPIAGQYMHERKWADIEKAIRRAILRFEPRLEASSLGVAPLMKDETKLNYNVLLFEIRGRILTEPYPTSFIVQSAFDLETNRISII
ncbi:type VI secretion system baseplate subunit TssE [Snodgrassella alvi]|uniref:type VI secretion system baseplate subunit TssE n=1 Tax=Snodgrassella alvi TaxID=1196083 RepID=UPI000A075DA3|nr:type VI secretion system baseplate subunit TssE [Snodgrassella alvi]ORF40329.1 cytoplasmic protein [Snodgrassella alvi]PXY98988.1 type VI secretion system baseplate subunit TssE [Snodgrassella alvi]